MERLVFLRGVALFSNLTLEQLEARRGDALFEKVRGILETGEYKKHDQFVDRLFDAGHTPTDIASALITMLDGETPQLSEIAEDRQQRGRLNSHIARVCSRK